MYPTLSKKQFVYWLLFAFLVQIVGITKATAQGATTPFKTTWKVAGSNITIPTNSFSGVYNYTVKHRKQGTTTYTTINNITGNRTISGLTDGDIIEVEITGVFPHFYMNDNATEKTKLLSIEAWGNQNWKSMSSSFDGCSNLSYNATDVPDLSLVTSMRNMFNTCSKFNGNIGGWNTSAVTDMGRMFNGAGIFNQNISSWVTSKVTSMDGMFSGASAFNQPIGSWNTAAVSNMSSMFGDAIKFNQNISLWETGNVTDMGGMFRGTIFNQPIGSWKTDKVTSMAQMFYLNAEFNQDISQWNTANVTSMWYMFGAATKFNKPLTNWNTIKVTDMSNMFNGATAFNQDLSVLEINAVTTIGSMLDNSGLSATNYDATLTGWLSQNKTGLTLGAALLKYCNAETARTTLTKTIANGGKGWTISGDSKECPSTPFKTTWKVANGNIIIPTLSFSGPYNYTVNYRKQGTTPFTTISNQTGNCTISGLTDGDNIEVEITGVFPHFYMNNNATEKDKLLSIDAWGNQNWKSMNRAFWGCSNLIYNATDSPGLSTVTDMSLMFTGCAKFNGNIGTWNTSNVTNMSGVFAGATIFNQDIGSWNTANVTNMYQMFQQTLNFNQNIGNWNTGKVTDMGQMFFSTTEFNQNLSQWNVGNVVGMRSMFLRASKFNQPLTNWNTAKVTDMSNMFSDASAFNQDLSVLEINAVNSMTSMLDNAGLSVANYDATLTGWLSQNKTGVSLGAAGLTYCNARADRTTLTTPIANSGKGWTITGDKGCTTTTLTSSQNPSTVGSNVTFTATVSPNTATGTVTFIDGTINTLGMINLSGGMATLSINALPSGTRSITAVYNGNTTNATSTSAVLSQVVTVDPNSLFITRWDLSKTGSGATQINFGVETSGTVNYTWQQVGGSGLSGSGTFTGTTATITGLPSGGVIDLNIEPTNFQRIDNFSGTDKSRLIELKQWGSVAWTSMYFAFARCDNFTLTATDVPNLTGVTNMSGMFLGCKSFNQALPEGFNTSNVTDMSFMFGDCIIYNKPLPNSFSTANVRLMYQMFMGCKAYNQDLPLSFNTEKVTVMFQMFSDCEAYNKPLPNSFNTSAVTSMGVMFKRCRAYNQILPSSFNTSAVKDMNNMFSGCLAYNQALPNSFNTAAVTNMSEMFSDCRVYNQPLPSSFNTSSVTNMSNMFYNCFNYNQPLPSNFNTAAVTTMNSMFSGCFTYNQPLPSNFNTSSVTDMSFMFSSCVAYNQPLPSNFNTTAVTNMNSMFYYCSAYNHPFPNNFNTAAVKNMSSMFFRCSAYNEPLPSNFNTAAVTNMSQMFNGCTAFNQPLPSNFNTAAVINMSQMFNGCTAFNQPLSSNFNTAAVTNMSQMFNGCTAFNEPLPSNFNTAAVTNMSQMFNGCTTFNQNVGNFNITAATNMTDIFKNSGISIANYDAILTAWNTAGYTNKNLGDASPLKYCASAADRANLVKTITNGGKGWTITGDVFTNSCIPVAAPTGAASQTFCAGRTVADLVATGQNIKWYDAVTGGNVLPASTVLINGTIYYATQTVSGVESTNRLAVTATVNALPVLNPSSNSPVCSGQTLFLYAKGGNQSGESPTDTYTWTGVNSFTANTQNPFISNVGMNANGVYTVSATSSANCSATATILVTVKETPTLVVSNFTNPTPENNPDGTISFTTNLPNGSFSLGYGSTGSPRNVTVSNGAFILGGLVSGIYANFAVTNDGCTGRNNTEVTLLSTPFTLVKSITTGNWESSTTWNIGRVPKAGDVVIIDGGHAVTINANSTIKDMEVRGQLIYGAVGIIINLGL
jgi:surface protein